MPAAHYADALRSAPAASRFSSVEHTTGIKRRVVVADLVGPALPTETGAQRPYEGSDLPVGFTRNPNGLLV